MKLKKLFILLFAVSITLLSFGGCSPNKERIQEALDKLESADAISIQGNIVSTIDTGKLGTTNIEMHLEMITTDEAICITAQYISSASPISVDENINIDMYIFDDHVYIY